jgi:mannose-6-phosphate isomerase-like protein (cupin superfamily)
VSIGFVIRRPPDASGQPLGNIGGPLIHEKVTEIYYVLSGSGDQVTGGQILDGAPQAGTAIGPGLRGTKMKGGHTTHLVAGDMQIIPAGTVHMWSSVGAQGIDYLVFRIDPEKASKRPTESR